MANINLGEKKPTEFDLILDRFENQLSRMRNSHTSIASSVDSIFDCSVPENSCKDECIRPPGNTIVDKLNELLDSMDYTNSKLEDVKSNLNKIV